MSLLAAVMSLSMSAAPIADVWPWKVERLADGSYEYSYDLVALATLNGSVDARAAHGEEAVTAFFAGLPKEVKVHVKQVTGVTVSAGRGVEPRPLSPSFAAISEAPIRSDNPSAKKTGPKLRMPLHPDEPKILASVDAVVFAARSVEDGTIASIALELDGLRKELLTKALDHALHDLKLGAQGDGREGSIALAARTSVALACLDVAKLPAAVKANPDVLLAAKADAERLLAEPDANAIPRPYSFGAELTCAWQRAWAISRPFPPSRAGNVAALTFLDVLAKDAKAKKLYESILARRDRYLGPPLKERIKLWSEKAEPDPFEAIDRLSDFLEKLPYDDRTAPELMALPSTPFTAFGSQLKGSERGATVEELAQAVADGRLDLPLTKDAPWPVMHEGALSPLLSTDAAGTQFDAYWRDRLVGLFATLVGAHHEARGDGREREISTDEKTQLQVRLQVPPHLDAEPVVFAYTKQAASLERLVTLLNADKLQGLKLVGSDGRRTGESAVAEAKRWAAILRGLALLSGPETRELRGADVDAARKFIASWRQNPAMQRDVRSASLLPVAQGDARQQTAIVGVARRELAVTFSKKPQVDMVGAPFVVNTDAEQRYVVPVLQTLSFSGAANTKPMERSVLVQALEKVQRDPARIEASVVEAQGAP